LTCLHGLDDFSNFFAKIVIFAVFAKIADLVGALFDMFSSTRRFFQFSTKIVIFAAAYKPGHISDINCATLFIASPGKKKLSGVLGASGF